jgi:hypothetical protein
MGFYRHLVPQGPEDQTKNTDRLTCCENVRNRTLAPIIRITDVRLPAWRPYFFRVPCSGQIVPALLSREERTRAPGISSSQLLQLPAL